MGCCISSVRIRKKKISALPAGQPVTVDDFFEAVQEVDGVPTNVKVSIQDFVDFLETLFITISGGGGSLGGVVPPEGVVTAAQYTLYTDTNLKNIWIKESPGVGNTGWLQY